MDETNSTYVPKLTLDPTGAAAAAAPLEANASRPPSVPVIPDKRTVSAVKVQITIVSANTSKIPQSACSTGSSDDDAA